MTDAAFTIGGQHPGDRITAHLAVSGSVYLHGDPAPTINQVAAVLHALGDLSLNHLMLSDEVSALGAGDYPEDVQHANGLGRWFHLVGEHIEGDRDPSVVKLSPAATILAATTAEDRNVTVDTVVSEAVIRQSDAGATARVSRAGAENLAEQVADLAESFRHPNRAGSEFQRGYNGGLSDAANMVEVILRAHLGLRHDEPLPGDGRRQQARLDAADVLMRRTEREISGVDIDDVLAWILRQGGDVRSTQLSRHLIDTYGLTTEAAKSVIYRLDGWGLAKITDRFTVAADEG